MAKVQAKQSKGEQAVTAVSPTASQNFRARIVYKSGATQDFLIVATATTAFEVMRQAYIKYLNGGSPKSGWYVLYPGSVAVDWTDVSSFQEWTD